MIGDFFNVAYKEFFFKLKAEEIVTVFSLEIVLLVFIFRYISLLQLRLSLVELLSSCIHFTC